MLKKIINKVLKFKKSTVIKNIVNNTEMEKLLLEIKLQNGRIWSELLSQKKNIKTLHETEFKVFSQCGDDGIIQYLVNYLDIKNKTFIEFGVEDYREANTRFLLINNNWSGLIMDDINFNIEKIKKDDFFWKYDLRAKAAFITAENVNNLIKEEGFFGEIGLMHIDIDGNDYWIWKALEVVEPIIMIVEYNSVFGIRKAITVPYNPKFNRTEEHYSNLYFGASLKAFCDLASIKNYAFIGSNSTGNNAYFIKKDYLNGIKSLEAEEGYVSSKFRESRDENGNLNLLSMEDRMSCIKGLPVYNIHSKKIENF